MDSSLCRSPHVVLIAVSSNRRLLIEGHFKYFGQCPEHKLESMDTNWHCVYDPVSWCSLSVNEQRPKRRSLRQRVYGLKDAMQRRNVAEYFGDRNEVKYRWEPLVWSDGIFHQQWFHSVDNLLSRSHVQWFFASLRSRKQKYIVLHIQKSDNIRAGTLDNGESEWRATLGAMSSNSPIRTAFHVVQKLISKDHCKFFVRNSNQLITALIQLIYSFASEISLDFMVQYGPI